MLKTTFQKEGQKALIYDDFRKFPYTNFQSGIINNLNSHNSGQYCSLKNSFVEVLEKHAPKKIKIIRGNQNPHANETLRSAIM